MDCRRGAVSPATHKHTTHPRTHGSNAHLNDIPARGDDALDERLVQAALVDVGVRRHVLLVPLSRLKE